MKNLGFTLKKLKLGVDGPLREILKHQIEVDNNQGWPVSFLYDNLYWNK